MSQVIDSVSPAASYAIAFYTPDGLVLAIKTDGTLVRGETFTTLDEESQRFWTLAARHYPEFRKFVETNG
jgi:hypothetical protein